MENDKKDNYEGPTLVDEEAQKEYVKQKEKDWENYYRANRTKRQKQTKGAFGKSKYQK